MLQIIKDKNAFKVFPKINHITFYNKADLDFGESIQQKFQDFYQAFEQKQHEYEIFVEQKGRRPFFDIYSCFHPFNEATKAFFPFIKLLKHKIKPQQEILVLWDRNGLMTCLLSAIFPNHKIRTTWENDKDVLGYQGFHYWFQKEKNIEITICDLNHSLPFETDSFQLIVGLDTFHRFDQSSLLSELIRVGSEESAIIFPHIHLSNNEPEPFFERGCKQIHGLDYQHFFDEYEKISSKKGYVLPEPTFFWKNDVLKQTKIPLVSEPNSEEYNALLALLPKSWQDESLSSFSIRDIDNLPTARVWINPLLDINLHQETLDLHLDYLAGRVAYLLERHPIYVKMLQDLKTAQTALNTQIVEALYWAEKGRTLEEIAKLTYSSFDFIKEIFTKLENKGIVQVMPFSFPATRLFQFISQQKFLAQAKQENLATLWQTAQKRYAQKVCVYSEMQEDSLSYEEVDEIVSQVIAKLQSLNINKGEHIFICSSLDIESLFVFWACMQVGVVVVPLLNTLPTKQVQEIANEVKPKLIFGDEETLSTLEALKVDKIVFDGAEENEGNTYFSDWLADAENMEVNQDIQMSSEDIATILFTTGSTGKPKGVQLSQGNLYRSARLITENFRWLEKDKYLAFVGLESMSGLRNTCIAPLVVGASLNVPNTETSRNFFDLVQYIKQSQTTILASNPAFLKQLVKYKTKVSNALQNLRMVMCTGSPLTQNLRKEFKENFNLNILNYYGLTETTGICLGENEENVKEVSEDTVGLPLGCIAQIVDDKGQVLPIGEKGELRIYSDNIMQGYLNQPHLTKEVIKKAWFYTGDWACWTSYGHIKLLGRKREIIKNNFAEVVYIAEVESFMTSITEIDEVAICAYTEEDSEKMQAFMSLKEEVQDSKQFFANLKQIIQEKIGVHKTPSKFTIVEHFPRSTNGKILKNQLKNT